MTITIESVSNVIELKPGCKYLLVFNGVSPDAAQQVLQAICAFGVESVGVGLGDGESVEIVEVPSEKHEA